MELKTDLSLGLPGCDSPDKKNLTLFGKELDCHVTHNVTSSSPSPPPSAASASGAFTGCLGAKRGFLYGVAVLEKKNDGSSTPATKTQVVGWPPIRSYRKNTLSSNSTKSNEDGDEKCFSSACLYVKVSMDGAPYLRKVDIQTYRNYVDLSSALEKMFGCFITGKYGSYRHPRRGEMGESQSADHHCNTEYVLTYEDKDGDWMLVGDIPWKMFSENCRKLRIMKGSEAIGLTPKSE